MHVYWLACRYPLRFWRWSHRQLGAGNLLGSSVRAVWTLNHWALSLAASLSSVTTEKTAFLVDFWLWWSRKLAYYLSLCQPACIYFYLPLYHVYHLYPSSINHLIIILHLPSLISIYNLLIIHYHLSSYNPDTNPSIHDPSVLRLNCKQYPM